MAERPWGFWTESKLDMLSDYLHAFNVASTKSPATVYLDLFAGQEQNINKHTGLPIDGSLRRALATKPPFTVLRGFELRPDRAASHQRAYQASAPDRDLRIYPGDVHDSLGSALIEISGYNWAPTFAFVDPDGVEARWELLERLAAFKRPDKPKVEIFLLLASPQVVRVVNDSLDPSNLRRAKQQVTDLFGSGEWEPILDGRRNGALNPEQTRDELTNLMRWRLESALGYSYTHALRLTTERGTPLYDMVFATDHKVGDKIMSSIYGKAAEKFPQMRRQIRARGRDALEAATGAEGFWSYEELAADNALAANEKYVRIAPTPPYGSTPQN